MFEYLIDRRVADVIDQLQRAKPRKRVRRFHDDAQKRKRILDMRRLREPDPAELAKRNALPAELERKSTAISLSGTPSSRRSAIRCATNCDCSFSSCALTTTGACPPSMRE